MTAHSASSPVGPVPPAYFLFTNIIKVDGFLRQFYVAELRRGSGRQNVISDAIQIYTETNADSLN